MTKLIKKIWQKVLFKTQEDYRAKWHKKINKTENDFKNCYYQAELKLMDLKKGNPSYADLTIGEIKAFINKQPLCK